MTADVAPAPKPQRVARPTRKISVEVALPPVLHYAGEFGTELICFIPSVYWLHQVGLLHNRKVRTYAGMRAYYPFLDDAQFLEKHAVRSYIHHSLRPPYLRNRNEHRTVRSAFEAWPDYRAAYRDRLLDFGKPVLVVNNKYCREWNLGPVNYLSCDTLDRIFGTYADRFQIIYFRDGLIPREDSFSADRNAPLEFGDAEVLDRHPKVIVFDELLSEQRPATSYNELKLRLFASTHFFITSQGGGAHLCSLFSGALILVMHRVGREIRHSYAQGFYRYAANPAPTLLIARNTRQFEDALAVFAHAQVHDGRAHVGPAAAGLLDRYAAAAQHDPAAPIGLPAEF